MGTVTFVEKRQMADNVKEQTSLIHEMYIYISIPAFF